MESGKFPLKLVDANLKRAITVLEIDLNRLDKHRQNIEKVCLYVCKMCHFTQHIFFCVWLSICTEGCFYQTFDSTFIQFYPYYIVLIKALIDSEMMTYEHMYFLIIWYFHALNFQIFTSFSHVLTEPVYGKSIWKKELQYNNLKLTWKRWKHLGTRWVCG